jgi:hypothetical protein
MATKDPLSKFPQQLRVSGERTTTLYVRKPGYYAVHGRQPGALVHEAVALFNEGAIAIFRGEPDAAALAEVATIGPVYTPQPGDALAVPTGLIFVRFAQGVPAESHAQDIERAGYALVESPAYAPHAAWLRARSGDMADALVKIGALEKLPDMANVEPQMLMERAKRS